MIDDGRDIVALALVAACILIFGVFGYFLPDWIGISPRQKKKQDKQKNQSDTNSNTDTDDSQ